MLKFKDLPNEEKPRERLTIYGASALSNEELLMIILKTGTKKISVKELANQLLIQSKSFHNLNDLTLNKLMEIEGIGQVKAVEILAVIELSRRISLNNPEQNIIQCTNPTNIIYYFHTLLKDKLQEEFYVLYLDNKKKYLAKKKLFIGSINSSIAHPREIFKNAYLLSASYIICIHNHPSGDPTPSQEDINITKNLNEIAKLHAIYLVDHIIIGNNQYYSFYENQNILTNN